MEDLYYKLEKNYQGVLIYILRDYPDLRNKVRNLEFRDKPMMALFKKLNDYHPGVKHNFAAKKEKPWFYHKLVISGEDMVETKRSIGAGVGAGYELQIVYPQLSEKYSMDFGCFFNRYWNLTDTSIFKDFNYLRIPVVATYRFNREKFSPFVSGGMTIYYLNIQDFEFRLTGSLGITLFKHYVVSATIEAMPIKKLNPTKFFSINLGYLFGKH